MAHAPYLDRNTDIHYIILLSPRPLCSAGKNISNPQGGWLNWATTAESESSQGWAVTMQWLLSQTKFCSVCLLSVDGAHAWQFSNRKLSAAPRELGLNSHQRNSRLVGWIYGLLYWLVNGLKKSIYVSWKWIFSKKYSYYTIHWYKLLRLYLL